jgi:cytochrome b pre-mRNA-processing protein 3
MGLIKRFFASSPDPREELRPLWHAVVAEAREPVWYRDRGVADTLSGRFDMVSAVLSAVLLRMERSPELAQASVFLTELFVEDMDGQLREIGVNDVVVGKRITKLMGAMGGRLAAYRAGLSGVDEALDQAVERNVTMNDGADPTVIARGLRAFAARLARTGDADLLAGRIAS